MSDYSHDVPHLRKKAFFIENLNETQQLKSLMQEMTLIASKLEQSIGLHKQCQLTSKNAYANTKNAVIDRYNSVTWAKMLTF